MKNTEKFWDGLAKEIDVESDQLDHEQKRIVKKISHYLKATDVVLDYGCARGGITLAIADKVKEVKGIDISSKMISIANKRLNARQNKNVSFDHCKISNEQLKPQSHDVIIALNVIHLVEDPDLVFERLNKLLKPEGLIITLTPCLGERKNVLSFFATPILHFIVKLGLIPTISFFNISQFEKLLTKTDFIITERKQIQESMSTSYFVIAKKRGEQ